MENLIVQVRDRGVITLPSGLREKYQIENGTTYQLLDLEGIFVLVPMVSVVPELAQDIEKIREDAGLSISEMLVGIREQREQYLSDHHGK